VKFPLDLQAGLLAHVATKQKSEDRQKGLAGFKQDVQRISDAIQ
jgi:hypothetical protein